MPPAPDDLVLATAAALSAEGELIRAGYALIDALRQAGRTDLEADLAGSLSTLRLTMHRVYGVALPSGPAAPQPAAAGAEV